MKLSIVIPAYEEETKISEDVKVAADFLVHHSLNGEIIVADDGSGDDTSGAAKRAIANCPAGVAGQVLANRKHLGKGHAVSKGIKASAGDYVLFVDSGNCIPYSFALDAVKLLKDDSCDIVHASRKLSESNILRYPPLIRRGLSWLFHVVSKAFMGIPGRFTDSQCGFKMYKGDIARQLYRQCQTDGFMFDIEVMLRALKQGYRIKEIPVDWTCDRDSRLLKTRSFWEIFGELVRIRKMSGVKPD